MRRDSSVTSISWIPSEAMTGPMRVPMDLHIGHYDQAPPDHLEPGDLEELQDADRYRFANNLAAWVEVEDGTIVDAGYTGAGLIGSTTAKIGLSVTIPGVAFPLIQEPPSVTGDQVVFHQTAGGRTGAPLPHRIKRPPYVRMTAPTAWTSLSLTINANGDSESELTGASPFPRHWVYDHEGALATKSAIIDFAEWEHSDAPHHTPWHDFDRSVLMSDVESQVERNLSGEVMGSKPDLVKLAEGSVLIEQGQPGGLIHLVLDGMLRVDIDGEHVAELGPGAIVGERAIVEGGFATATVTTVTPVRVASIPAENVDRSELEQVAATRRPKKD